MKTLTSFLKPRIEAARKVSPITHKSVLYHTLDCLYCNLVYGCRCYQYSDIDFYKLRSFDRAKTLTSGHLKKASRYNDPQYMHIADRKNEFNERFSRFIGREWLYCRDASEEELSAFFARHPRVIIKPNESEAGEGVSLLLSAEVTDARISELKGSEFLLEECLAQHPDLCFGGRSVNTIRVATMVDSKGEPHILKAALRCGIGGAVVDNFSRGGVGYPVNIGLGIIEGYGIQVVDRSRQIYVHPGTDIVMVGRRIPYWQESLDMVREAAKIVPQIRYVGWDVAITPHGPVLIEVNPSPGFGLLEGVGNVRGIYGEIMRLG